MCEFACCQNQMSLFKMCQCVCEVFKSLFSRCHNKVQVFVVPSEICDKGECMEWTNSYGGLAHASNQASALAGFLQKKKINWKHLKRGESTWSVISKFYLFKSMYVSIQGPNPTTIFREILEQHKGGGKNQCQTWTIA